jgi:hypothetical protein
MSSEHVIPVAKAFRPGALLFTAALAAVLSLSCAESAPAGPTATLVPSDAIAAVVVESPYKLLKAGEAFWKAAGLDATFGSDLQGMLEKSVPNSGPAAEALDFARPWALAVVPRGGGEDGGKRTRMLLYVPYRPSSAPSEIAGKIFAGLKLAASAKGYMVLSDSEGQVAFPPAKGADLSRLSRYSAASVKLWGDPAAIRRATADGYKSVAEAARRFVTEPPAPGADAGAAAKADPGAAAKAMAELGLSLLSQLGLADASIELDSAGLTLRVGAAAAKGSDLQKALAAASSGPPALEWASQVDAGAMYGLAWSMDPALVSGLYQRMADGLFSGLGLPLGIAAKAAALEAKWSKAAGPRGALSLDMDVDADAIAGAGSLKTGDPAAVADFIKKALRIRFEAFQDIKDEAAYRALLRGFAADPDYLDLSKAYADAFGISFSIDSQEKEDGGFSYGELGIKLKVVDGGRLDSLGNSSSKAATEAALAALESLVSARWAISNGRFLATSGELQELEALAARKSAVASLADDKAFSAFARTMPPRTVCVGTLSVSKLMALAGAFVRAGGSGAKTAMPDPSLFGSWYSYIAVDARGRAPGLEAGLLIPASDIGALARMASALSRPARNGGA